MERIYYRSDLVRNFPVCYAFPDLVRHFATEYECVVGRSPNQKVLLTIAKTFLYLWKKLNSKENFLNKPKSRSWLQTPLPISDALVPQHLNI